MKIVLVCAGSLRHNAAGVEQSVYYLAQFLQKKKMDVEIFSVCENPIGKGEYKGLSITEFPGVILNKAFYYSTELEEALRAGNHDIIHAYGTNSLTTLNALRAKKPNQKLVITGASSVSSSSFRKQLHPLLYSFYRKSKDKIDRLICVSEYEYELFRKNIPLNENKYVRIPNGIDVERFAKAKKKVTPHTILTVARLVKQKGVHRLIYALPFVLKKHPNAILHVVGDGAERKRLEELARKEKVHSHVIFHGHIQFENMDELVQLYSRAHVFSLMADSESQGLVYSMAVASRVPIVATDSSAMKELIHQKVAYGVNDPDDPEEVAHQIMYGFEHPIVKVNLKKVLWSWDRIGNEVLKIYNDLATQRKKPHKPPQKGK